MTRINKYILIAVFIVSILSEAIGQQVFPVQVVGSMIPPRSLDLTDYTVNRTQDLFYNAILSDPVEPTRLVKLKLTIRQNGEDIYVTDPNFFPPPITLQQFQMETFDGGALQPYLNPTSLIGVNGGQGSVVLPEGFNHICLEVIDIEREIPISNQFCVRGDFFLNQPPMPQLPVCDSEIQIQETQNLLFNWMPMHIGSSNSPGAVEYEFTLVEILPGTMNPNDGFESQLQIYQTTVFTPSLLYSPGEPLLSPNKTYGWRVQAKSVMAPFSLLFQNQGYSQVCTFTFTENGGEESNTEPPTACEVFNTKFGPLQGMETIPVQEGDLLEVGFFEMEVTQVYPSSDGYGGTGSIEIPMLNTKVEVTFNQLKVNDDSQVFSMETCKAIVESEYYRNPNLLEIPFLKDQISEDYMESLDDFYSALPGKDKIVSKFNLADPIANTLPIGMDKSIDGEVQPIISIIGLRFTPTEAYMTAVASEETSGGELMRFVGVDIPITPYGVKSDSPLFLVEDNKTPLSDIFYLVRTGDGEKGSGINFDCTGFKDFEVKYHIQINENTMVFADDLEVINLKLSENTDEPESYLGNVDDFDDFVLPGLEGFRFRMEKGQLDLKGDQKLTLQNSQNDPYQNHQNTPWEGLALEQVIVELPEEYDFRGNNERIELDEGSLYASGEGVFGDFRKLNLVNLTDGRMGDWPYSVDTFQLSIQDGNASNSRLSGQIRVPVLDDPFAYSAELDMNASTTELSANPKAESKPMSMWNASFDLEESTIVNATLRDLGEDGKEFFPFAELKGALSLEIDAPTLDDYLQGNKNENRQRIRDAFGITGPINFELDELPIESFLIDPFAPERYVINYVGTGADSIKIGNRNIAITEVNLIDSTASNSNNKELGLQVLATSGSSQMRLTIWAKQDATGGFVMERIETNTQLIECDCVNNEEAQNRVFDLTEILEGYYEKFYAPNKPLHGSIGSLASVDNVMNKEEMEKRHKAITLSYLNLHHVNGFIVDDIVNTNWLKIPFLGDEGTKIKVAPAGGKLKSVWRSGLNKNQLTVDNLNNQAEADDSYKLPYDLTNQLSDFLGGNPGNIPPNARLVLTGLEVASNTAQGNIPNTTTIELMMIVEIEEGNYVRFGPTTTSIAPNWVTFGAVDASGNGIGTIKMFLTDDFSYDHEDYPIEYKKSDSETFSDGSFAYWSCDGFQKYNVQGEYKVICHQDGATASSSNTVMAKDGEFSFKDMIFPFIVDGHSLTSFIAPLKTEEPLVLYQYNAEVDKITIEEGYFDMDVQNNKEGFPEGDIPGVIGNMQSAYFTGVYMKEIEVEIIGLFDKAGGARVPLKVDGADFMYHHSEHLLGKIEKTDLINYDKDADLGGWPYTIDELKFHKVEDTERNTGTYIWKTELKGNILIPLFEKEIEGETDPTAKYKNWIPYVGDLMTGTDGDNRWTYGGQWDLGSPLSDQAGAYEVKGAFSLKWAPGFLLYIDGSSSVGIKYNNNEFEPFATLNGSADIALSDQIIPSGASGDLQMRYSLLEYENLKINYDSGCGGGSALSGMKSIDFGNWCVGDCPDDDDDEDDDDEDGQANATDASEDADFASPDQALRDQIQEGINNFPIAVEGLGFECRSEGYYKFFMAISLNLSRDPGGNNDNQGVQSLGGGAAAAAGGGRKSQRQSAGLKASTQFALYYKKNNQGKLEFDKFGLDAIAIEGSYGPVTMNGFLIFINKDNPDPDAATRFGDGFKAYVDLQIGGLRGFAFKALGLFGATRYDHVAGGAAPGARDYRYFFVDIEATMEQGIQIPYTPIYVHGLGGGFYYNMIVDTPSYNFAADEANDARSDHLAEVTDNTNILLDSPMSDLMVPQATLSQFEYFPAKDNFGGSLTAIFSIGNSPKVCFDAVINVGLNVKQSSLGFPIFGLSTVGLNANLYMMAESIANRRDAQKGTAIIQYDHNNFRLSGSFNVDFEINLPSEEVTAYGLAVQGEGVLLFQLKDSGAGDSGKWYIKMGRPPLDERFTVTYTFAEYLQLAAGFYGQIGHDLDPMPALHDLIPNWNGTNNAQRQIAESVFSNGDGLIMGMSLQIPKTEFQFLIFKPWFYAGAGFDISLMKFENPPPNCFTSEGNFGINNWYARGQAYFYIGGGVDLYIDLRFPPIKMDVTLLEVAVAAAVQAELPNPTWMKARVQGSYNVLGGLVSGSFNIAWELGERCEGLAGQNPFSSIPIIADTDPANNAEDFPVFGNPKAAFNMGIEGILTFEEFDDEGNSKKRFFRPFLNSFRLYPTDNPNDLVPGQMKVLGLQAYIEKESLLEANTSYTMEVKCSWQERINGVWTQSGDYEEKTVAFTTGAFPDQVESDHVEYQAPGNGQRYWTKDYAKALFRFKENGWDQLFYATNQECIDNGYANCEEVENGEVINDVAYDYTLKVTEYPGDGTSTPSHQKYIPIDNYPGLITYETLERSYENIDIQIDGNGNTRSLQLPYMERIQTNGKKVEYKGLNEYINERIDEVRGERLYKMELLRIPVDFSLGEVETEEEELANLDEEGYSLSIPKTTLSTDRTGGSVKILYRSWFATSKYETFNEKMKTIFDSQGFGVGTENNNSWEHPLAQSENTEIANRYKDPISSLDVTKMKDWNKYYCEYTIRDDGKTEYTIRGAGEQFPDSIWTYDLIYDLILPEQFDDFDRLRLYQNLEVTFGIAEQNNNDKFSDYVHTWYSALDQEGGDHDMRHFIRSHFNITPYWSELVLTMLKEPAEVPGWDELRMESRVGYKGKLDPGEEVANFDLDTDTSPLVFRDRRGSLLRMRHLLLKVLFWYQFLDMQPGGSFTYDLATYNKVVGLPFHGWTETRAINLKFPLIPKWNFIDEKVDIDDYPRLSLSFGENRKPEIEFCSLGPSVAIPDHTPNFQISSDSKDIEAEEEGALEETITVFDEVIRASDRLNVSYPVKMGLDYAIGAVDDLKAIVAYNANGNRVYYFDIENGEADWYKPTGEREYIVNFKQDMPVPGELFWHDNGEAYRPEPWEEYIQREYPEYNIDSSTSDQFWTIAAEYLLHVSSEVTNLNNARMNNEDQRRIKIYAQKGSKFLGTHKFFDNVSDNVRENLLLNELPSLLASVSLEREMILRLRRALDSNPKMLRIYTLGTMNPFEIEGISIDDSQGRRIAHFANGRRTLYTYSEEGYSTEESNFSLDGGYTDASDFLEIDPAEIYQVYIKSNLGEKIILLDQEFWGFHKYGRGVFSFSEEDLFPDALVSQEGGNHALYFSADENINQYVDLTGNGGQAVSGSALGLPMAEITVEGWFKINDFNQPVFTPLIGFGKYESNANNKFSWGLALHNGDLKFTINTLINNNVETLASTDLPSEEEGKWIHFAASFDGANLKVYANGELVGEKTLQNADLIKYTEGGLFLGGAPNLNMFFNYLSDAMIDEVAIWNVARCQEAIINDMQQGLTGEEEGLWGYYNFDEKPGSSELQEMTGNRSNGVLVSDASDWSDTGWAPSEVPKEVDDLPTDAEPCNFPLDDYALEFDESSEYITIDEFNPPSSDLMTIEVWVKTEAESEQTIIHFESKTESEFISLKINELGQPVFYESSSNKLAAEVIVNDGKWHHLAVSRNEGEANELILIVDGIIAIEGITGTLPSIKSLYIGADPMNSSNSFIGQLDELAIWNSQRSLEEIRNDALEGIDENSESLEQYYDFNHGPKGSRLHDKTLNSRYGTLVDIEYHQDWKLAERPDHFPDLNNTNDEDAELDYVLEFDGEREKVELPFILDPGTQSFSILGWIKPISVDEEKDFLLVQQKGSGNSILVISCSKLISCLNGNKTSGVTKLEANKWYHVALTWDTNSSFLKLYLNGNLEVEKQLGTFMVLNPGVSSSDGEWQLGANKSDKAFFYGQMDDFSFWNRALSEEQIIIDFVVGIDLENLDPAIISYYDFEDGPGSDVLTDRSQIENNSVSLTDMEIDEDWKLRAPDDLTGEVQALVGKLGNFWLLKEEDGIYLQSKDAENAKTILEIHAEQAGTTKKWYRAGHFLESNTSGEFNPQPFNILNLTELNMAPNGETFSNVYIYTTEQKAYCVSNVVSQGIHIMKECSDNNHPYANPIPSDETDIVKIDRIRGDEGFLTDEIQITYRNSLPADNLDVSIYNPEGQLVVYLEYDATNVSYYQHDENGIQTNSVANEGDYKFELEIGINYTILLKDKSESIASASLGAEFWGELPVIWRNTSSDFLPNAYSWNSDPAVIASENEEPGSGTYQVLRNGPNLSLRANSQTALEDIIEIGVYRANSTWKYYQNEHRFENDDGAFGSAEAFSFPNALSVSIAPADLSASENIDHIFVLTKGGSIYCVNDVNTSDLFDFLECEEESNPYNNATAFEEEEYIKVDRLANENDASSSTIQITYQNSQSIVDYDLSIYDVSNRLLYSYSRGSPKLNSYQYDAQGNTSQSQSDFEGNYEFSIESGKNHMVFLRDENNKSAMAYLNNDFWEGTPVVWKKVSEFTEGTFDEYFTTGDYALQFDGTDEYIALPEFSAQGNLGRTICAWIKPGTSAGGILLSSHSDTNPEESFFIGIDETDKKLIFQAKNDVNNRFKSSRGITENSWQHIACVIYPNGGIQFYINGQNIGVGSVNLEAGANSFYIGSRDGEARFFNGLIDDLSIWNSVMFEERIREEYLYGVDTDQAGLISYYSFNDGPGSEVITDQINNRNGQLSNMEIYSDWVESDKQPVSYNPGPYYVEKSSSGNLTLKFQDDFIKEQVSELYFKRNQGFEHYFDKYHYNSSNNSFVCESFPENGNLGNGISTIYIEDKTGNYYGLSAIPDGFTSLEKLEIAEVPDALKERQETPNFFYITEPDINVDGGGGPNPGMGGFFFDMEMPRGKRGGPCPDFDYLSERDKPEVFIEMEDNDPRTIQFNFYNSTDDASTVIAAYIDNRRIYYRNSEYARTYHYTEIDVNEDGTDDFYSMSSSDHAANRLYLELPEDQDQAEIYVQQGDNTYKHIYEVVGDACTVDAIDISNNGANNYEDFFLPDSDYSVYHVPGEGLAIQFLNSSSRNLLSELYISNEDVHEIIRFNSDNQVLIDKGEEKKAYYNLPSFQSGLVILPDYKPSPGNNYSIYLKTSSDEYFRISDTQGRKRMNLEPADSLTAANIFNSTSHSLQFSIENNPNDSNSKLLNFSHMPGNGMSGLKIAVYDDQDKIICLREPSKLIYVTYSDNGIVSQDFQEIYSSQLALPASGNFKVYYKLEGVGKGLLDLNQYPNIWNQSPIMDASINSQFKEMAKEALWINSFSEDIEDNRFEMVEEEGQEIDYVLQLDGVDDYVDLGEQDFSGNAMSMSVWVKLPNDVQGAYTIAGILRKFTLEISKRKPRFGFYKRSSISYAQSSFSSIEVNQWCHLLAVYNEGVARIYLNDFIVGSKDESTDSYPLDAKGNFYLGRMDRYVEPYHVYLNTQIDDLRVWNVALSHQQALNFMLEGIMQREDNLIIHLDMNDGPGSLRATDISNNGNDGLLQNMNPDEAWVVSDRNN